MRYPLYEYYAGNFSSAREIYEHYEKTFYCKKYGRDKAKKVCEKAAKVKGMEDLFEQSKREHFIPSRTDFGVLLNGNMWFAFQSNRTQALAMLFLYACWESSIGFLNPWLNDLEFEQKILEVFKKGQLYEEMTKEEFEKMSGLKV